MAAVQAVERAGQALLDEPLLAVNNVLPLLAKLRKPNAHDEVCGNVITLPPASRLPVASVTCLGAGRFGCVSISDRSIVHARRLLCGCVYMYEKNRYQVDCWPVSRGLT